MFVWKAQLARGVYEPINAALLAEVAGLLPTPGNLGEEGRVDRLVHPARKLCLPHEHREQAQHFRGFAGSAAAAPYQPPRCSSEAAEVLRLALKAQLARGVYEPINAALLAEVAGRRQEPSNLGEEGRVDRLVHPGRKLCLPHEHREQAQHLRGFAGEARRLIQAQPVRGVPRAFLGTSVHANVAGCCWY